MGKKMKVTNRLKIDFEIFFPEKAKNNSPTTYR